MNGRNLDSDNDIFVVTDSRGKNHVSRASSFREKTMRLIGTTLRTEEGECFTDYEAGIPWFSDFLGNSVLFVDEISQEIKDRILAIKGVSDIVDLRINVDGRNISGRYKVRLDDGSTEIQSF